MRKKYEHPDIEILEFKLSDVIMDGDEGGVGTIISGADEGVEDAPF